MNFLVWFSFLLIFDITSIVYIYNHLLMDWASMLSYVTWILTRLFNSLSDSKYRWSLTRVSIFKEVTDIGNINEGVIGIYSRKQFSILKLSRNEISVRSHFLKKFPKTENELKIMKQQSVVFNFHFLFSNLRCSTFCLTLSSF